MHTHHHHILIQMTFDPENMVETAEPPLGAIVVRFHDATKSDKSICCFKLLKCCCSNPSSLDPIRQQILVRLIRPSRICGLFWSFLSTFPLMDWKVIILMVVGLF